MTGRWITTPSEVDMATCAGAIYSLASWLKVTSVAILSKSLSVRSHSPISASSSQDPKAYAARDLSAQSAGWIQ